MLDLPRSPAFADIRPADPVFVLAPCEQAEKLLTVVERQGIVEKMTPACAAAEGYYRIRPRDGASLFVKVFGRAHLDRQTETEALVSKLPADAPVMRLEADYPKDLDDGHIVFAYPFVAGRFARATTDDMARIGRSVARLHRCLGRLADVAAIRDRTARRIEALEARRRAVVAGRLVAGPEPERLRRLAGIGELKSPTTGIPNHGDLNIGNVLLPADGGDAVVLDFEDTVHSWGPPILDLALALERFCLSARPDGAARKLSRALLASYGAEAGHVPIHRRSALAEALIFVNLRALCILIELEAAGERPRDDEWIKFFELMEHVWYRRGLVSEIEEDCL